MKELYNGGPPHLSGEDFDGTKKGKPFVLEYHFTMDSSGSLTRKSKEVYTTLSGFEQFKVRILSLLAYWIVRALGSTLRWEVQGWENHRSIEAVGKHIIYTFWHGRILPATCFWRNRGIVVMTSHNRDGEYIARVIRRFGYRAARGSSSRGGKRALVEMIHEIRKGNDVAFTIDGPRGPLYVAKPGAVWLAAKTDGAILPFHVSPQRKWVLKSWDRFHIPKPFTRTLVLMAPAIHVKRAAKEQDLDVAQKSLQSALDDLRYQAASYWRESETA